MFNIAVFNMAEDICSMTEFKRRAADVVHRLRNNGRAVILTPNGKADIVVEGAASYQKLFDRIQSSESGRLRSGNGD